MAAVKKSAGVSLFEKTKLKALLQESKTDCSIDLSEHTPVNSNGHETSTKSGQKLKSPIAGGKRKKPRRELDSGGAVKLEHASGQPAARICQEGTPESKKGFVKKPKECSVAHLKNQENKIGITALKSKLEAGRFRYLNELLYTVPSQTAFHLFQDDPDSFNTYHRGYRMQTEKWPVNPIEKVIAFVKQKPRSHIIADMGCGDAKLAKAVNQKVHSFDLYATNEYVTVADIADVPLKDHEVDVVVFCLSLMGTNLVDFLTEANRVLKPKGIVKVMEIVSRFGGKLRPFTNAVEKLGFTLHKLDTSNSHFVDMEFKKLKDFSPRQQKPAVQLLPCLYKKR